MYKKFLNLSLVAIIFLLFRKISVYFFLDTLYLLILNWAQLGMTTVDSLPCKWVSWCEKLSQQPPNFCRTDGCREQSTSDLELGQRIRQSIGWHHWYQSTPVKIEIRFTVYAILYCKKIGHVQSRAKVASINSTCGIKKLTRSLHVK